MAGNGHGDTPAPRHFCLLAETYKHPGLPAISRTPRPSCSADRVPVHAASVEIRNGAARRGAYEAARRSCSPGCLKIVAIFPPERLCSRFSFPIHFSSLVRFLFAFLPFHIRSSAAAFAFVTRRAGLPPRRCCSFLVILFLDCDGRGRRSKRGWRSAARLKRHPRGANDDTLFSAGRFSERRDSPRNNSAASLWLSISHVGGGDEKLLPARVSKWCNLRPGLPSILHRLRTIGERLAVKVTGI